MPPIDISPFTDAVANRFSQSNRSGRATKVIGWFCTYTPIEIIHAAGFIPERIRGGTTRIENADQLCPSFVCPYLRASLERAMHGHYDHLSGVVCGYTCDAVCGMINIWEENIPADLYHTIPLPYHANEDGTTFFHETLDEFARQLETIGGTFDDASLSRSLDIYRDIRETMLALYDMRSADRLRLTAREFYTVIEAGFALPPDQYHAHLLQLISAARETATEPLPRPGIPIIVSGSIVEDMDVFDIIEEAGGRIADDDLCTGRRYFDPADGTGATPMDCLIDRYQRRFPCPSRSVVGERTAPLLGLIKRSGARGVVFLFQKFCTPHLADYPDLIEELKRSNIPTILIEMEEAGISRGQLLTRLEGFFEMIGDE